MPETVQGPLPALSEDTRGTTVSPRAEPAETPARRRVLIGLMVMLACGVVAITVPGLRWRLQVVYLVLVGRIPDLEVRDLPGLLLPGSRQPQITRLVATHNPYAVIHVPSNTPG